MSKPLLNELFQKPNAEFTKHLNDPENARILFSGKFGIGKTTFINQFFEGKKEYVKIHLYPVNYSIASNEDIIDLIKYDILMELINTGIEFEEEKIPLKDKLYGFSQNNALEILRTIINCVPKTGKDIASTIKGFEELYTSFQKYCNQISSDEGKDTLEFIEKIQNGKGSIYEQTVISRLISAKVKQFKNAGSTSKRQVVLIIDDLDRIDPEHIFRLFNVFAAHFDSSNSDNSSNKFEFDKVVFVCDVDNIRSIFKHRYGLETDFGGYIDKFYSREVFNFDNILNAAEITEKIISNIEFKYNIGSASSRFHYEHDIIREIKPILSDYIHVLILLRIINTRKLTNYYMNKLEIDISQNIFLNKSGHKNISELPFLCACKVLKCFWGEDEEFLLTLNKYSSDLRFHNLDTFSILLEKSSETIYIYQTREIPEERFGIMINNQNLEFISTNKTSYKIINQHIVPRTNINILELLKHGIEFLKVLELHNFRHLN